MIVRSQPGLFDILFAVNGSILPRIARRLAVIAFVSVVAILAAREHPGIFAKISTIPFTLIGIALSVFMSFRNDACYTRWWEGRELWGELIIASRSLARETALILGDHQSRQILRVHIDGVAKNHQLDERHHYHHAQRQPVAATLFAFGMFSVMGLSPFKGSYSKFLVLYSAIEQGQWLLAAVGTLASIVAAIYTVRVIQRVCLELPEEAVQTPLRAAPMALAVPLAVLAGLTWVAKRNVVQEDDEASKNQKGGQS